MKYIEFGIGNTWLVRTETELADGTEYEERGIKGPVNFRSFYIRLWLSRQVWIIDTKEGFKHDKKSKKKWKLLVGIVSH